MPEPHAGEGWLLIHDLQQDRDPGVWLALGLAVVLGIAAVAFAVRAPSIAMSDQAPALMAGLIALGVTVAGVLVPLRERHVLLGALRAGRVAQVEGVIDSHRVWREQRSDGPVKALSDSSTLWTSIRVAGIGFEFLEWPFARAMERRGLAPLPLHDGLRVRIAYVMRGRVTGDDPRARRIVRFECRPERADPRR